MLKEILINIHLLIFNPKRFYKLPLWDHKFETKDLVALASLVILSATFSNLLWVYFKTPYNLEYLSIHGVGYLIGQLIISCFRIYFLAMILTKIGYEITFKKVGIMVFCAMVVFPIMYLMIIMAPDNEYNQIIWVIFRIWNLVLVLLAVLTWTQIRFGQAVALILVMYLFEFLIQSAVTGYSL